MSAVLPDVAAVIVRLSRAAGIVTPPVPLLPVPGLPVIVFGLSTAHGDEQREWYAVPVDAAARVAALVADGTLAPDEIVDYLYDDQLIGDDTVRASAALGRPLHYFHEEGAETITVHPCAAALTAACEAGRLLGWCAYGYALGVTVSAEHPDAAREILAPLGYVLRAVRRAEACPAGTVRQTWIFGA